VIDVLVWCPLCCAELRCIGEIGVVTLARRLLKCAAGVLVNKTPPLNVAVQEMAGCWRCSRQTDIFPPVIERIAIAQEESHNDCAV
jgi:hypothetical protein